MSELDDDTIREKCWPTVRFTDRPGGEPKYREILCGCGWRSGERPRDDVRGTGDAWWSHVVARLLGGVKE